MTVSTARLDRGRLARKDPEKSPLILVSSIGNPSPRYDGTRHSVGHYILEKYCDTHGFNGVSTLGRYEFRTDSTSPLLFYHNQGYMNVSGDNLARPWLEVMMEAESRDMNPVLVVISDELDIDVGKMKVRKQTSSARGHNGLRSIQSVIGGGYTSIKVGIGRANGSKDPDVVAKYVLSKFSPAQLEVLDGQVMEEFSRVMDRMVRGKYIYE
ncbi:DEKNAAC102073 [Brettanomyces naardenensis]|uniref:peptidyl-tRNA hydrolase n=1 Tax=Brettanomyces naardenensis TaxID=13370 RepID=A0A448YJN7_BRENA|nr:DEKNAAC102073 [Brettanomyces naardenensis]